MKTDLMIVAILFVALFAAALLFIYGIAGRYQARLRERLRAIKLGTSEVLPADLIRQKYLHQLSPWERSLEQLPGMARLARWSEQAGKPAPGYRLATTMLAFALVGMIAAMLMSPLPEVVLAAAVAGAALPLLRVMVRRAQRMKQFEEQLPDALEMMARALRAGNPLTETFKFAAEELEGPIAEELGTTWSHLNFGLSLRTSFEDLLERMPSTSLQAMATAILVQRETGGNLAEILDKIASVLRARFRFQRRLRALTAEGRLSAWVLISVPFALALLLTLTSPTYLPLLYNDPLGRRLIGFMLVLMVVGTVWIRNTVRIRF